LPFWSSLYHGGDFKVIQPNPAATYNAPGSFSPDESKIVYAASGGSDYYAYSQADVVMVANSDGSDPVQLTDPSTSDIIAPADPMFSPDGSKIAFVNTSATDGTTESLGNGSGCHRRRG
jgi:Tol biopolymer transport system component